jgi:hypothetical protein
MAHSVTWLAADGAAVPVALRSAQPGDECAIFQLPVGEVRIDGLPAAWTDGADFDVAELQCAHRFHPCALALHFAAYDMRCPVCRQGPPARLAVPSVSRAMQPALAAKAADLCAQDAPDAGLEVEIDLHELLRDLTLQVDIIWANAGCRSTRTVLRSPLRCDAVDAHDAAPDSRQTYTTHRSFQRLFNSNVTRAQANHAEFRFSLLHPLLPYAMRSPIFDGAFMRGVDIPLSHGVAALRVRTDPGPGLLDLRVNTHFLLMMCVQHVMRQYEHLMA